MIYINMSQCGGGLLSEELALFPIEVVLASSRIYSGAEHFPTEFPCGLFGKTNLVFVSCSNQTVPMCFSPIGVQIFLCLVLATN